MSPFDRLMYVVSKRISSAGLFSSWIVILFVEGFMDSIVPVCCWGVWEIVIRRRMPRSEIRNVIFWRFIVRKPRFSYELSCL